LAFREILAADFDGAKGRVGHGKILWVRGRLGIHNLPSG
jgi:hypothetical protein